ncbi:RNA polymerase sigma factor [Thiosulfatimonas sediminis]|uniref:RNA polymerase sigma factor n=1 Tax=Thiosulfatimonas sediminis TaxID=2675054 RepID=A0A6F8PRJ4_9GAMM|nr:sigma-70 family RNA polymerase sigma factor [Thiosulfatimonas sediminis]BBP44648.1 RNA polymerase sigma factor [Thiosulfatimonas sediminis]
MGMSQSLFDYEAALLACAAEQRSALTALYQQEAPRLIAVVYRILQNQSLAEEIVHDAFIKIWTSAQTYRPELGSARGWIYTLTRNLALNALQKNQRQVQADPEFLTDLMDQLQAENEHNASNEAENSLHNRNLYHCIEQLNEANKQCILQAYIHGYTQEEIAHLMDKPIGTIKTWIRRSLQALKECLQ